MNLEDDSKLEGARFQAREIAGTILRNVGLGAFASAILSWLFLIGYVVLFWVLSCLYAKFTTPSIWAVVGLLLIGAYLCCALLAAILGIVGLLPGQTARKAAVAGLASTVFGLLPSMIAIWIFSVKVFGIALRQG